MKIEEFEKELQEKISKDISIKPSKVAGLAGVYYQGTFLVGCPADEIFETKSNAYGVEMPNGMFIVHRTHDEVFGMAQTIVKRMNEDKDYSDAMTGSGDYSNKKLGIKE